MLNNKKQKFYLSSILSFSFATSLLVSPVIDSAIAKNSLEVFHDGFNQITPTYHQSNIISERPVLNYQFDSNDAIRREDGTYSFLFGSDPPYAQKVSSFSKNYVYHDQILMNFFKPRLIKVSDSENRTAGNDTPTYIVSTLTGSPDPAKNDITMTRLANGTGLKGNNNPDYIRNAVASAQLIDNKLWLLTAGFYPKTGAETKVRHMLQTFDVTIENDDLVLNPTYDDRPPVLFDFNGVLEDWENTIPPVISPIYEVNSNNELSIKPNEVIVWQQNLNHNDIVANKYTLASNGLNITPIPVELGVIDNAKTLAITPVQNGMDMQYFIHHSVNNNNTGIALSRFENPTATSRPTTVVLNSEANIANIDVKNQMSYAKIAQVNDYYEFVYAFPKIQASQVFSITINENFDSFIAGSTSILNLGSDNAADNRDISKVEYTNIITSDENYFSLKLSNSPILNSDSPFPALVNLSQLKNKDAVLEKKITDFYFGFTGETTNISPSQISIGKVNNDSIDLYLHNSQLLFTSKRLFSNLEALNFETVAPVKIVENKNPQGLPQKETFSKETEKNYLQKLIYENTQNAVLSWIEYPASMTGYQNFEIFDSVFHENVQSPYFEIIYRYTGGEYDSSNKRLDGRSHQNWSYVDPDPAGTPVHEGTLGAMPAVPEGVAPYRKTIIYQQNNIDSFPKIQAVLNINEPTSSIKPSSLQKIDELNSLLNTGGTLPFQFWENSDFSGLIGITADDLIQINFEYLTSLSQIIINTNDFTGNLSIQLAFNNQNSSAPLVLPSFEYNQFLPVDVITYSSIAAGSVVLIVILTIIFVVLKKRKKKDLSKALFGGFALHQKLGVKKPINILEKKAVDEAEKNKAMTVTTNSVPTQAKTKVNSVSNSSGLKSHANNLNRPQKPNYPSSNLKRPMDNNKNKVVVNPSNKSVTNSDKVLPKK